MKKGVTEAQILKTTPKLNNCYLQTCKIWKLIANLK